MGENEPSYLKVVLTWQELLNETSRFFRTYLLQSVLKQSEPPTFPHTTATFLTPRPQSASGLIGYKNLICQNISPEGRECEAPQKQQVRAGAGLGRGNRAGLVQDPLPTTLCTRFPQAWRAGTIPTALPAVPGQKDGPQSCHPEHEGQGRPPPLPAPTDNALHSLQTHSQGELSSAHTPKAQNSPPGQSHPPAPPNSPSEP